MRREEIVESWMTDVLKSGGIPRFDDLHIDQIDPGWKDRNQWLDGGLEAFRIAASLRDRRRFSVDVALAFSLEAGRTPRGVDFQAASELKRSFDWSPPSLYLLPPGRKLWEIGAAEGAATPAGLSVAEVNPILFGASQSVKSCCLIEFMRDVSDFTRTLIMIG